MEASPRHAYEIRLGNRTVSRREGITAQQAVLDYLRSMGCQDDEVARVGTDSASWRGAVYVAVPEDDAGGAGPT